jgi:hypothetical protein
MSSMRLLAVICFLALVAGCGNEAVAPAPTSTPDAVAAAQRAQAKAEQRLQRKQRQLRRLRALEAQGQRGPDASGGELLDARARRSFERLSARLDGREGVAIAPIGQPAEAEQIGALSTGVAWSTAKVPVALAAVEAGVGSPADLRAALTASDNAVAERLWTALGEGAAAAATAQLRAFGDDETMVEARRLREGFTAFGQTDWSLAAQARFMSGLGCAGESQVVRLMGEVVPAQRWGLGNLAEARFKGGWGPGRSPGAADGWLERQLGLVSLGDGELAVAIATDAPSHELAINNLDEIARWLADTMQSAPQRQC